MAGGLKRDKLDAIFSLYIRTPDAWTCQRCGTFYQEGSQGLHCSHFIGRRNRAVRWDPDNACAHCMGCHMRLEGNPFEFGEWIQNYLGNERYLALRQRAMVIPRLRQSDLQAIYENIACKLAALRGEPVPTFRAPKAPRKRQRASGKRARASRYKRRVDGSVVLRSA